MFKKAGLSLAAVVAVGLAAGLGSLGPTRAAGPPAAVSATPNKADVAPPPAEAKAAPKRVEVKGTVVGPDDKPVAGAKLFLHRWEKIVPAPQTDAGADGTFAFTLSEDEVGYSVVATAPGHGIAWGNLHQRPVPAFTLRLTPEEPIRGKVVNLEGKPVAGVSVSVVTVYQPTKDKTLDRWLKAVREPKDGQSVDIDPVRDGHTQFAGLLAPATSDRDGTFEVRGVGRDRIAVLRATGPTTATYQLNVVTRKIDRFTGRAQLNVGDDTFHGAAPVVVAAPVPVTTGRVLDGATGEPVPGTVLYVEGVRQQQQMVMGLKAVADKDGRFTLPGLAPEGNPLVAVIVVPPDGTPYHTVRVPIPDGVAERAAFDVKLVRGVPTTVKIIDKVTRKPVKAQLRYGVFPDDNPNVKVVPNVWHNWVWTRTPYQHPYESEFRIVAFPGRGLLAAAGWGHRGDYLSGVGVESFQKYRHEDQLHGLVYSSNVHIRQQHTFAEIDVPADAKEFAVTLELDPGLAVSGRLVDADGKPVAGAESYGLRNSLDSDGSWAPPASDEKFAALALRSGEKRRVMFVHTERKLAGTAIVVGGAKEPVLVRMEPWGEAAGRIVGADGKPVAGRVDLLYDVVRQTDLKLGSSPAGYPGMGGPETDKDGRFRITGLVPGLTYRWIARGWKHGEAIVPDTVPKAGETTDLGDVVVRPEQP